MSINGRHTVITWDTVEKGEEMRRKDDYLRSMIPIELKLDVAHTCLKDHRVVISVRHIRNEW